MSKVLRMQQRGLTSFQSFLTDNSAAEILYVEGNSIQNFEGLGTQTNLRELHCQNNNITSFAGMTTQRSLQVLNLAGNPIASRPLYRLMALMTVGSSLVVIDGEGIRPAEKEQAIRFGRHAAIAINCGWLLDGQPHTVEEYAAITENLKRARRASQSVSTSRPGSLTSSQPLISPQDFPSVPPRVSNVADAVPLLQRRTSSSAQPLPVVPSRRSPPATGQVALTPSPMPTVIPAQPLDATPSEAAHVIAQLHGQIAALRGQLDDHRVRLQREQQASEKLRSERAMACDLGNFGLGMDEVRAAAKIEFGGGLKLSTNAVFTTSIGQPNRSEGRSSRIPSAHISIDANHITIAHHFTRVRMGDVPMSDVKDVLLEGLTVFLRLHDSTVFEISADDRTKAIALHKALYFFRGMLPPSEKAPPSVPSSGSVVKKPATPKENPAFIPPALGEKKSHVVEEALTPASYLTALPAANTARPPAATPATPMTSPGSAAYVASAPKDTYSGPSYKAPAQPAAKTSVPQPVIANQAVPDKVEQAPAIVRDFSGDDSDDFKIPSSDDESPKPAMDAQKTVGLGGGPPLVLGGKVFGAPARRSESSDY